MPAYLYCVLPADAPEPVVAGIDGGPVRVLRHAGVSVWLGEVAGAPRPDLERIRAHDAVLRAAMDAGVTPVPVRFGQVLPGDDAVRAHLEAHDYRPALERIRGAVEFGIRIVDPEAKPAPAPAAGARGKGAAGGLEARERAPGQPPHGGPASGQPAGGGTAYLRRVAERLHAAERAQARALAAARSLDEALADGVRERRIEVSEQPPGAVLAHLVQAGGIELYREQARALSQRHPPLRIVVTGPWPPYSFVDS